MVVAQAQVEKMASFLRSLWDSLCLVSLKNTLTSICVFLLCFNTFSFEWDLSYAESRQQFLKRADSQVKFYEDAIIDSIVLTDKNDLFIDYLYIPARKAHQKLWVISAGVHGIESIVGSSIVNWLLYEKIEDMVSDDVGIVLIHSLNPYGYSNLRRVNENNVDLNRNFILDFNKFKNPNLDYANFDNFLNPKEPVRHSLLSKMTFWMRAAFNVLRYGMDKLRESIVGGQYSHKKGIFYGGNKKEKSTLIFDQITSPIVSKYQTIFHIDLHTGYGKRGKLHFYGMSNYKSGTLEKLNELFRGFSIDRGSDKDFYRVHGDITSFFMLKYPDKLVVPMTFEYGTLDSQTILGSMESLYRIKRENQFFHYGSLGDKNTSLIKKDFVEMFNPSDQKWKLKVEKSTVDTFQVLIPRFMNI
jgi:hypothetical protein